jgi:predicted RNA-binding Zn ribbon-like protein
MTATVPAGLELVVAFLNTLDLEAATDELADVAAFTSFLARHGLADAGGPGGATPGDLDQARALRAALRAAVMAHHEGAQRGTGAPDADQLDRISSELPLVVTFEGDGEPRLVPVHRGARGALSQLLALVVSARAAGDWARVKICPDDTCLWAFYDQSRNRSRRWCSMDVCGNRTKTRAYRSRHANA